jgi:hypothetical protein
MHLLALLSGLASLLAVPLFHLVKRPGLLDWGFILAIVAVASGALGRKQRAGRLGVLIGLVGLALNGFYLHYLIKLR